MHKEAINEPAARFKVKRNQVFAAERDCPADSRGRRYSGLGAAFSSKARATSRRDAVVEKAARVQRAMSGVV